MASAVEIVWQWLYLVSIVLIILILCCCFCGFWDRVLGGCASGINFVLSPFRRRKTRELAVEGEAEATRSSDGPWRGPCRFFVSAITCCYCCGALKPQVEGEEHELVLPRRGVAQPIPLLPGKGLKRAAVQAIPAPAPAPAPALVPTAAAPQGSARANLEWLALPTGVSLVPVVVHNN